MTVKLYQQDSYAQHMTATVLERRDINGRPAVRLDQTIFYPTSGGQMHDGGRMDKVNVLDVIIENDEIWHILEQPVAGDSVEGELDWRRRFDFMQQHTGFHILAGAFKKILNIETLSSHLGENQDTIDVEAAELAPEQVLQVENLANQIIWEDRPVNASVVDAKTAAQLPIRKSPVVTGDIRLIEIMDFDLDPCGGTHVNTTGQVGLVKIIGRERIRKNLRFTFVAGERALRLYQVYHDTVSEWMNLLTTDLPGAREALLKLIQEQKRSRKALDKLSQRIAEQQLEEICALAREQTVVATVFEEIELEGLRLLARRAMSLQPGTYLFGGQGGRSHVVMATTSPDLDLTPFFRETMEMLAGKGGGDSNFLQGSTPKTEQLHSCLEAICARILQGAVKNY